MARPRRNATINVKSGAAGVTVTATGRRRLRRGRRTRNARTARGSRTVSVNVTAPARGARRVRRSRAAKQTRTLVRRALVRAGVTGPRPALVQRATATLGTVGANQGDNVEREGSFLLNPALTKETTGSNQFGPIQVSAASYGLWKMKSCVVKVQPLVGASAVSGTIVRISLNQTATPSQASWSALGARKHVDTTPGKPATFTITERDLCGPKEGWFMTNTKTDPQMCIGGSIDVHTYGKTMSAYTNTEFGGPLFILEMTATWMFASYNPESAMLNLIKGAVNTGAQGARLVADAGEALQLVVPPNAALARAVGPSKARTRAVSRATPTYPTVGEVIFSVVDATVSVAANLLPWPISWLVGGGWWFIKKITGLDNMRAAAGEAVFNVYASIADAKNNIPVMADSAVDVALEGKEWSYQQVTPGNFQGDLVEDGGGTGGVPDPANPPQDWYYLPNGLPTCPNDPTTPGIDPADPPAGWYYYPNGPPEAFDPNNPPAGWMYLPDGIPPCPNNPGNVQPLKGQAYQWVGSYKQIYGQSNTYSGMGLQQIPVWGTTQEKDSRSYPLQTLPNFSFGFAVPNPTGTGTGLRFQANAILELQTTNLNGFFQMNGNSAAAVDPTKMNTSASIPMLRYPDGASTTVGQIYAGNTINIQHPGFRAKVTYLLARATSSVSITAASNPNYRYIFNRDVKSDGTTQNGWHAYYTPDVSVVANPAITAGRYYLLVYLTPLDGQTLTVCDPAITVGLPTTDLTIPEATWEVPFDTSFQFSPTGVTSGIPITLIPFSQTMGTWTQVTRGGTEIALDPASGTNQTFTMDELIRALKALEAEGRTDSGRNGEELSGDRPPTPYDNVDGCLHLKCNTPLGDDAQPDPIEEEVSDGEEESETDSDESDDSVDWNAPIPCECNYGGHPECPLPEEDEDWNNLPDDIVDTVDGINIALVQKITTLGVSEMDAKRMVQSVNPSAAVVTFKDKFHAAMYDGCDPATARGLAYCHALRKKENPDCLVDDLRRCTCASCQEIKNKERV